MSPEIPDDSPETGTPMNARVGVVVMVVVVLLCLAITLAVLLLGGVNALIW
jgi:hypothetical protein